MATAYYKEGVEAKRVSAGTIDNDLLSAYSPLDTYRQLVKAVERLANAMNSRESESTTLSVRILEDARLVYDIAEYALHNCIGGVVDLFYTRLKVSKFARMESEPESLVMCFSLRVEDKMLKDESLKLQAFVIHALHRHIYKTPINSAYAQRLVYEPSRQLAFGAVGDDDGSLTTERQRLIIEMRLRFASEICEVLWNLVALCPRQVAAFDCECLQTAALS